ncbi:hypothetical protein [Actinomadura sp. BRA 177]|nr:hypothetical protein [Actinomadura sp. BRA 177]
MNTSFYVASAGVTGLVVPTVTEAAGVGLVIAGVAVHRGEG